MKMIHNIKDVEALKYIRDFSLSNGRVPSTRELMRLMGYRSPRSAFLILNRLTHMKFLKKKANGSFQVYEDGRSLKTDYTQTVKVPLVGVAACGKPIMAEENLQGFFSVSTDIARPPHKYFLLKAKGDSMNLKGVLNGDLLLIRQQNYANKGDVVVALVDNEATIKEFQPYEDAIALMPCSTNKEHAPIIVNKDFQVQGIMVSKLPNVAM